eukprot:TRINITY_DN3989_c0_g2_i4.p1 TRINITY_DN3989_c0_g2~~TRINITY_DN3989_c0_g2_i4.p1  ORF type:complete len:363 (-),score=29.19 TRINITY_DN3989_c0_g2_i4:23-1111(-)
MWGSQFDALKFNQELKGLTNHGNTCYLNAALQVIRSGLILSSSSQLEKPLLNGLKEFYRSSGRSNYIQYLEKVFEQDLRRQSDAGYFLARFLEKLNEEDPKSVENFAINNMTTTFKCLKCGDILTRKARMKSFSVAISPTVDDQDYSYSRSKIKMSVQDMVTHWMRYNETKTCQICGVMTNTQAVRQFRAEVLSLRIASPYDTPEFYVEPEVRFGDLEYELNGVVVHSGHRSLGGHYYALVKDKSSNQWYNCNDSSTYPVQIEESLRGVHLTVLIYHKKNSDVVSSEPDINTLEGYEVQVQPEIKSRPLLLDRHHTEQLQVINKKRQLEKSQVYRMTWVIVVFSIFVTILIKKTNDLSLIHI